MLKKLPIATLAKGGISLLLTTFIATLANDSLSYIIGDNGVLIGSIFGAFVFNVVYTAINQLGKK